MSEIMELEWAWVDLDNRRVKWPDSKTGGMSKPMSVEAAGLFETAPRFEASPFVRPAIFAPRSPMSKHTYHLGWKRMLERAGASHVGTHGIRRRPATDIANSGVPVKVGMALTAQRTVRIPRATSVWRGVAFPHRNAHWRTPKPNLRMVEAEIGDDDFRVRRAGTFPTDASDRRGAPRGEN